MIQIVCFYQSDSDDNVFAAHNRGVGAWGQVCNNRRFPWVGRSVAAVLLVDLMRKIRNSGALVLRCTVKRLVSGPVMVRFLSITNSSLVKLTIVTFGAKLIVSPDKASRIARRKEPAPLSFPFVTVMVAAALSKSPATTTNAKAKQNPIRVPPKTLPMCRSPSETASSSKRKILWMLVQCGKGTLRAQ